MSAALIIPAAGSGTRFGGPLPKQFLPLAGHTVLQCTLARFAGLVDEAVLAVDPVWGDEVRRLASTAPFPVTIVAGGATRQDSVQAALQTVDRRHDRVLVHDAVRPCVPVGCIAACLAALDQTPGAVVAIPCAATVKREGPGRSVIATVPREGLWLAQTPQGLRLAEALAAFALAPPGCTDDVQVLELAGHAVTLVLGDARNLKITTPDELRLAEAILAG